MINKLAHHHLYATLALAICLPCTGLTPSLAQVSPPITPTPGTGDLGTIITQSGNVYNITGGTRPDNGVNLFHSFGEFGVPANSNANFLNEAALPTSNILGRITAGNPSLIFGTIQTTEFGSANLFLMNPAGFLFGPTATLNVAGMVTFMSADYMRLGDGVRFNSIPNAGADTLLTAAPIAAFGFLGSNHGAITVQGSQLMVTEESTLSLVGGNITIESGFLSPNNHQPAGLSAPNGRIHLASTASPGEFLAQTLDQTSNFNGDSFGRLGTVQVLPEATIDTGGTGGGTVLIRAGHFLMDGSVISSTASGLPTGQGIDIQVSQDAMLQNDAGLEANILEESLNGNSGGIRLSGESILIRDSFVEAVTEGEGNAGSISLQATNDLSVDNSLIFAASFFGSGNAGDIELTSAHGHILMSNSPLVTSQTFESSGNSGRITVNAKEGNVLIADLGQLFTATRGTGRGGGLEIAANNLQLTGGSFISDDNLGPTKPADINISLSGTLNLQDGSFIAPVSRSLTGAPAAEFTITAKEIFITGRSRLSSETFRAGQGGNLEIFAETVELTNGGQIRSGSTIQPVPPAPRIEIPTGAGGTITIQGLSSPATSMLIDGAGSGIFTTTEGTGAGGTIHLSAQTLTLQNSGTISASASGSAPSGTGGSIAISATDQVTITDGGLISASSTGPANAGSIHINTGQNFVATDSSVTTEANQAGGGAIKITTTPSGTVQLTDSTISASVLDGTGGGGSVDIDPQFVILQNSQILAQADQGPGGNISITTNLLLQDANSMISASSGNPVLNGTVTIQSPNSPASGKIIPLSQKPLIATSLLNQHCASLAGGEFSSFTVAGRDSLPVEPGSWQVSPLAALSGDVRPEERSEGKTLGASPPEETALLSLRHITPAGFLTQAFAVDWSAGCTS